jgi:hypothetical protein
VSTGLEPIPDYLARLVDDAAIFPPGNLPLPEAVRAHRGHRQAPHAALVGPFVVSDVRLPELLDMLEEGDPLAVSLVVTGGAGAIEPAVRWATRSGRLDLRAVEVTLRDEDDLAHNAARVVRMLDQLRGTGDLAEEVPAYVEPPRVYREPTHGWLAALDQLASADLRLKLRTGGADAEAVPTSGELAACIEEALDRELPFKCTAGLHHAARSRDEQTGADRHGFLNVLLATKVAYDGAGRDAVAGVLDDPRPLPGDDDLISVRRWFTSFGSCSIVEPLHDLIELGLVRPGGEQHP